jgi:uncharacterized protein YndB with AHSA1/START domain
MSDNKLSMTVDGLTVTMTRQFNAPRDLVWKANTDPDLMAQWWGQRGSTTIIDQLDLRPGGAWRFIQKAPDGAEYAFRGEYQEIVPPERFTYTFEFEGMPGHIIVETFHFSENDGVTTITAVSTYNSQEDLDGMINSGMEAGAAESYDRLEELLATQAQ